VACRTEARRRVGRRLRLGLRDAAGAERRSPEGRPERSACRVSARRQHGGYQVALTLLVLATAAC
jgi:hypothetical protein